MADRADPPSECGVHDLPEHASSRRPQAGGEEATSSLAVEGELPEDGLTTYDDDGDDLMMSLVRKVVGGEEDEAETVEDVFVQARDAEGAAEELLVNEGWKPVRSCRR